MSHPNSEYTIESLQKEILKFLDPKATEITIKFMKDISEHFYKMSDLDKKEFLDDKNPELNDGRESSFSAKMYSLQDLFDGFYKWHDMFWEKLNQSK